MKSVFFNPAKIIPEDLNRQCRDTLNTSLGIEFTSVGPDYLEARMPVDHRTRQPYGVLNGGASLGLIETLASMAANLTIDNKSHYAVGQQIHAHHFKSVPEGAFVTAKTIPLHIGKSSQTWEVSLFNEEKQLVCKGTLTVAIRTQQ